MDSNTSSTTYWLWLDLNFIIYEIQIVLGYKITNCIIWNYWYLIFSIYNLPPRVVERQNEKMPRPNKNQELSECLFFSSLLVNSSTMSIFIHVNLFLFSLITALLLLSKVIKNCYSQFRPMLVFGVYITTNDLWKVVNYISFLHSYIIRYIVVCTYILVLSSADFPVPSITELGNPSTNIKRIVCSTSGGFPKPHLFWLENGKKLNAINTTVSQDPESELYTISSELGFNVTNNHSFMCLVKYGNSTVSQIFNWQKCKSLPGEFLQWKI